MITAEQARRIAKSKEISDTDLFASIAQRADSGCFDDTFPLILSKEQVDNLESLGYIVTFSETHTFINW